MLLQLRQQSQSFLVSKELKTTSIEKKEVTEEEEEAAPEVEEAAKEAETEEEAAKEAATEEEVEIKAEDIKVDSKSMRTHSQHYEEGDPPKKVNMRH